MKGEARFTPALFFLIGGFAIWAAHFLVIYSYVGLLCARPEWARLQLMNVGAVPLGVAASTVVALLALAVLLAWALRGRVRTAGQEMEPRFSLMLSTGGAGLAAIAIVWEGIFSILTVPACV
jgi:hypothetical protein